MTHYGMSIDTKRCSACNNCAMTCKVENNLPDKVWWSRAKTQGCNLLNTVERYTFCAHRVDGDELPACIDVCQV